MNHRLPHLVAWAFVWAATVGCGYRPDLPPTAKVTGTVRLDGKPLPRGTVQFVPDESKGMVGASGVGRIDATGRYQIMTAGVDGAIIGSHVVGIEAREDVDLNTTSFAPSLIPESYSDPFSSGLMAEVKAVEENVINFDLKSEP
jgi:hypothetical protein